MQLHSEHQIEDVSAGSLDSSSLPFPFEDVLEIVVEDVVDGVKNESTPFDRAG